MECFFYHFTFKIILLSYKEKDKKYNKKLSSKYLILSMGNNNSSIAINQ